MAKFVIAVIFGLFLLAVLFNFPPWVVSFPVDPSLSKNYYYNPVNGAVYYSAQGNWLEVSYDALKGVAKSQFHVLSANLATSPGAVFYENQRLALDPGTLRHDDRYLWDLHRVYATDGFFARPLEGADGGSFEDLGAGFWRDRQGAAFKNARIEGVERSASLKVLVAGEPVALYGNTLVFPVENHGPGPEILGFKKWPVKDLSTVKVLNPGKDNTRIGFDGQEVDVYGTLKRQ